MAGQGLFQLDGRAGIGDGDMRGAVPDGLGGQFDRIVRAVRATTS